jgi:hypothetical protein
MFNLFHIKKTGLVSDSNKSKEKSVHMKLLLRCLIAGCLNGLFFATTKAQIENSDSIINYKHYQYYAVTFFSGASVLIPRTVRGTVNVSFPYTSTDATTGVTTNQVFQSNTQRVYHDVKPYINALGIEIGGLRQIYDLSLSVGIFSPPNYNNPNVSIGYGYSWYFNRWGEHKKSIIDNRFVFRASLNLSYALTGGDGGQTVLGNINTTNNTIKALGLIIKSPDTTYYKSSNGQTKSSISYSKNLMISYYQRELSLLPKITIGNNPYRNPLIFKNKKHGGMILRSMAIRWELSLGYNIPVYDWGGIQLAQNNGHVSDTKDLKGSPISLKTQGLTFL